MPAEHGPPPGEAELLLTALLRGTSTPMLLVDRSGLVLRASDAALRLLDAGENPPVGRPLVDAVSCTGPGESSRLQVALERAVSGEAGIATVTAGGPGGWAPHWEVVITPLGTGPGGPGYVLAEIREACKRDPGEDLRVGRERQARAIEGGDLGTWDWDIPTGAVSVNDRWATMLGYQPGEITPDPATWEAMVHPADWAQLKSALDAHLRGETPLYESEHRLLHRSGEWLWVLDKGKVTARDAAGRPLRVSGTHLDITRRRRAEEQLRKLHRAVEQSPAAVVITDARGTIEYVNPQFTAVTGYQPEEVVGENPRVLKSGAMPPEEYARLWATISAGLVYHGELCNRKKNGELYWESASISPVRDTGPGGEPGPITHYIAVKEDITQRRRMGDVLRESEARFRTLADSAPVLVWLSGADGSCTYFNRYWLEYTGRSSEQEAGEGWLAGVHPEDRSGCLAALQAAFAARTPFEVQFRLRRHDGQYRWMFDRGVPRHTPGGAFEGYTGSLVDIHDLKLAEERRLELERRALHGQRLESLGVLAGGVAHDFNNLLTSILGNVELARGRLPVGPTGDLLEQAADACHRAADLTRQMLAYSGKGRFVIDRVDLGEVVQANARLLRAAVSRTTVLSIHLAPNLPATLADPGQVQQIIMNLLTNAAEAMAGRAGEIVVATGVRDCDERLLARSRVEEKPAPGRFVYLTVSDAGAGMDEPTLRRLFEPFYTTKFTGRGLGLSAVLGIVRGHRGAILLESEPGRGTTFTVLFPAAEPARVEPPRLQPAGLGATASAHRASGPRAPGCPATVLVVDDEEMLRLMCRSMLECSGYQVREASSGDEAVALFGRPEVAVDCVLLDLSMPGKDGVATFRELHSLRPAVPVLLSSGFSEQVVEGLEGEGLAGFLPKPYHLQHLRQAIGNAVARGVQVSKA